MIVARPMPRTMSKASIILKRHLAGKRPYYAICIAIARSQKTVFSAENLFLLLNWSCIGQ